MRVVIDTNILLSALISRSGPTDHFDPSAAGTMYKQLRTSRVFDKCYAKALHGHRCTQTPCDSGKIRQLPS
jgi:predicted nucleic acid-binding protein